MTSTSDRPSLPNLPTELAALDSGMRASVTRYAMRAVSDALAAPKAEGEAAQEEDDDRFKCGECGHSFNCTDETEVPRLECPNCGHDPVVDVRGAAPVAQAAVGAMWQPIETAPQTGRTLLLGYFNVLGKWRTLRGQWFTDAVIQEEWTNSDVHEAGWFETSVECDEEDSGCWPTDPTHWMPLPASPEATAVAPVAPSEGQA
jgi:DNA-directed RNA polymerase subunit RPC12/RpoP